MDPIKRIIYDGNLLQIGLFRCAPTHPSFENSGPIGAHLFVFPRTSVYITHAGRAPVVANPNVVMYYNKGQIYFRQPLSRRGDICEWFAFHPAVAIETIRPYDAAVVDKQERPFAFTHGPSDPQSYLLQRLVVQHVLENDPPDHLYVEESMLCVLERVIKNSYQSRRAPGQTRKPDTARAHADLVHEVKTLLATRFRERLTLTQIAQAVYSSPYHLSRLFRKHTGITIHNYISQLRLRTSLEYVAQPDTMLTELGLNLGYSSHSHFTKAFRRTFGTAPSTLRKSASSRLLREMSKIMIA